MLVCLFDTLSRAHPSHFPRSYVGALVAEVDTLDSQDIDVSLVGLHAPLNR